MKKILVNGYFGLNFGDDLFFKILFERYSNVEFNFYNNYYMPNNYKRYKKIFGEHRNVIVKKYPKIKSIFYKLNKLELFNEYQLNQYDATIFIGGSIFMETSNKGRNFAEKLSLYNYFFSKNKPVFILGSNFGPYQTDEFYQNHKNIFSKCTDVSFREQYSYDLFSDLQSVRFNPDIVFSLKVPNVIKENNSVGISIMNITNKSDLAVYAKSYENKIIELIKKLIEQDKDVTLFSFSEHEGDLIAINKILKSMDKYIAQQVKISSYCGNIEEFLINFAKQESIVSLRFHAVILSQIFKQNVYPLVYSKKTLNVLKDIGLDRYYCNIKDIDSLDLDQLLECLNKNKIDIDIIKEKANEHFTKLDDFITI